MLRASSADRQRAADVLGTALREGRLDAAEYDNRSRSVQDAKSVGELNALLADLPSQLGVRDWADQLRVRQGDREQVNRWLADAVTDGRLTEAEHERRLAGVASAGTYAELKPLVDGVPGPPETPRADLFVSAADRQAVLDRLAAALTDGLLSADEHRDRRADVGRAERYRQLDELAIDLGERANPAERARAVRRLDHAHAAGQLDAAEHAKRVAAATAATRDRDLAKLLTDLTPTPGSRATANSLLALKRRHRLTDAERELAAQELQHALDDGRLTLDEYDERVTKAYAAGTAGALRPLLDDLVVPDEQPPAGTAPRRPAKGRPAGLAVAVVIVVVLAVIGAVIGLTDEDPGTGDAAAGPSLGVRWIAAFDRPPGAKGLGTWFTDGAVIRARDDRVVAYDLADGHVEWTFQVPADNELCTMSRAVDGDVGIVGYGPEYRCTTIVGLDLRTGQPLWQRPRPGGGIDYRYAHEVALARDTAVIREPTGFVAVDARSDAQRWRLPVAKGCLPYSVTAAGDVAALLTACPDRTMTLALVDAASGKERWRAPLRMSQDDDEDGAYKATVVLSLDPVVVRTSDAGGAFIAFDEQGKRRATIAQQQPDWDLALDVFPTNWVARPWYPVVVVGDVLVAPTRKPGDNEDKGVAGFSLTDGRRLWHTDPGFVSSLGQAGDDVVAVAYVDYELQLLALSTQDGTVRARVKPGENALTLGGVDVEVQRVGDRYVVVSPAGDSVPPVTVIGPR
ncbi:hypothetical protein Prum_084030 [Phytohabitans rumicis]|uniref:Outer membrane protein assembly factor BamB n=2 Tax=Phytohabitans rumicis TaxID=1076125 RepID=A0A6V8LIN5_9ACTN|nr:hypothetical protein Prum_084030 [Phytohabitans rumicis]